MGFTILIVDDDPMQRDMLQGFLTRQGFQVFAAAGGEEALRLFRDLPVQLVLLDHRMPDINGDELLARLKEINPQVGAIMITAFGAVETAVRVMKLGAVDFLEKPVDLQELLTRIRALEQRAVVAEEARQVTAAVELEGLPVTIVGRGLAMTNLLSLVQRIAPSPWTVLIRGETGTGKELIAQLIHLLSPRKKAPFVAINCASIPENLFESELFGHERGAFTGANAQKRGRFELARGGTLFLDEVGELPLNLQAKLLRALQEKRISRVGSEQDIPIDVRLIAATNRDLRQMVEQREFRDDLYYRLHVLEIEAPPLRQRKEDLPELIDHFLGRFGSQAVTFSPEAMATLMKYPFPGNIRELEHTIQRTVTLARGGVIEVRDLPAEISSRSLGGGFLEERVQAMERDLIQAALERHGWVQTRAAEELGVSERVLRYKITKLGIAKRR